MCGIAGFNWRDKGLGESMNECIAHRGPDASGLFLDDAVTLSHRRLAIIDLSEAANQPMGDTSGRFALIFNGEIYNYKELREELGSSYDFKTQSDTEVILAGYATWGKDVVRRLNGIFAIALWDKEKKELFCARDHIGVKPLYYYWNGEKFIFASEVKSILTHGIPRVLNLHSFNEYLRVLYVPEPHTMIKDVWKLPPGHSLTLSGTNLSIKKYYEPLLAPTNTTGSFDEKAKQLRAAVEQAVERQLVADVPVGVYLSGGIDSSAVLASVAKVKKNVKTFSVGFELEEGEEEEKFNRDFELARETARHFGADHHELRVSAHEVAEQLESIIGSIDDPISNPTAIPMAFLSKFAKKEVTVVLTGNGGDELFGGYERYRLNRRADVISKIPGIKFLLPKRIRAAIEMTTLERLAQFEFEKDKRLSKVVSKDVFKPMAEVMKNFEKYVAGSKDATEALMLADLRSWLPDQALMLGDRMSMYGSVEERVPLLDREVVDNAVTLPLSYKVTPFETKKILKEAFKDVLPPQLFKEPKRGWFSPGAKWLRRPEILDIARKVLSPGYYAPTQDLFDWQEAQTMLGDHVSKKEYNLTVLWAILTFQIWAKRYKITL